ncbi:MAG: gamma-glutamylcyclotransferase [Spirosomataceae bacterium]
MDTDKLIHSINIKLGSFPDLILTESEKTFLQIFQPEKHFIVYGTLAPNRLNHHKVEHIRGTWHEGIVRGKLVSKGWGAELGYNGFKHCSTEESTDIQAFILTSEELPQNWQALDDFEGVEYKRILAQYKLANGTQGVGYIYSLND